MKTTTILRPKEGKISVFVVDSDKAQKIAEGDRVAAYDRAGNKLLDDLYADFPEILAYEKLQETGKISGDVSLRLGMFFETNYQEQNAQIHYLWYLKGEKKQIVLLASPEMSERMKQAEESRRLFFSGFDILRAQTSGDDVEIEKSFSVIFKTERICEECGGRFAPNKHARNKQYFCSRKCYRKNYYRKKNR